MFTIILVGINVSKEKHDCCIIDSNGSVIASSLRITNSKESFDTLYSSIL
ncbi:MAG: transposase [Sedimentibacter sp.]